MRNSPSFPFVEDILASLSLAQSPADDGAALARILEGLAAREVAEGGPYALTPGGTLADADIGMNIAASLFLRAYGVQLPNLDAYIAAALESPILLSVIEEQQLARLVEKYRDTASPAGTEAEAAGESAAETALLSALRRALGRRLAGLPPAFADTARWVIERTIRGNPDGQMSLMPLYVRQSLGSAGARFTDEALAEFSLANVFFWTAFIVYDDFWDEDEAAMPALLPVANLFARHYVRFFDSSAPESTGFADFFHSLMDKLDAANEWEMLSCRLKVAGDRIEVPDMLPEYGDFSIKFYPAAGQVLGPVAMLLSLGYAADSAEVEGLVDYFRHYLIAMQLNDDAHDWKEDLARGNISTAVSMLLAAWKRTHPGRAAIDLAVDMPELERLFWFETIAPLSESALEHARLSRAALRSLASVADPAPLERFIIRNERVAREALAEQQQSVSFLHALGAKGLSTTLPRT